MIRGNDDGSGCWDPVFLESRQVQLDLQLPPKSSINSYAGCLRAARLLSVQDVHDVEQMGGLRNLAAHGDTAELDFERAEFMERQVSRFLRRLEDAVASSIPGPELMPSP